MRPSPVTITIYRQRLIRGSLIAAAACIVALFLPSASSANVKLFAEVSPEASGRLAVTASAPRSTNRVVFYIDGRRRWKDEAPAWRLGSQGYLDASEVQLGKHRVVGKVIDEGNSVSRAALTIYRSGGADGGAGGWTLAKPSSDPGMEPPPVVITEPTPDPAREPVPDPRSTPEAAPLIDAGFERGFAGWNMDGVGDAEPAIAADVVRSGTRSGKVILTGSQDRSEMILDGSGGSGPSGTVMLSEGDERYYAFSFLIRSMKYGRPGAHNLITQLKSDGTGSPNFGLALWDFEGRRGLWSHGDAMEGDRFLAPVTHNQWNDVVIHFLASRTGRGYYEIFLNGRLIDSRQNVSLIRPDRTNAYIKTGIYRNGGQIPGTSELRYDCVRLGTTASQVAIP